MENNFIQMAASAGHALAYTFDPIFKHIDCVHLYFTMSPYAVLTLWSWYERASSEDSLFSNHDWCTWVIGRFESSRNNCNDISEREWINV